MNDQIIVAADRALVFHRSDGSLIRQQAMPRPVRAVTTDSKGGVVVTFSDQIARVSDSDALELVGESFGRNAALTGIAVADDGRLFAADSGQRVIWRLDALGNVLGSISPGGAGFTVPRAFFPITWQNGHLIVAEPGRHQIQRYTADGLLVGKWGGHSRTLEGFSGCCNPVAITSTPNAVITAERGQVRVKKFDAAGKLASQLAAPDQFAPLVVEEDGDLFGCEGGLLDVAATNDGRVVVLDRSACEILVLS
ncbi:hypothetical protein [Prosthecobacter sp.]|uniref:hypothetical protein n=1 Tax=Prosthecobacter sp. TaxID=1965333 RepID=UPI001E04A630|nr:hypothetical protein [Prosthecobacter sp.]MCB1275687.1 hypothetical protein [Prosthecobacter sp.]